MPESEWDKMLRGELYDASEADLVQRRMRAKRLCRESCGLPVDGAAARERILGELLGGGADGANIEANFRCDYGSNIYLGEGFYANFDLIILDVCAVRIGDHCKCGPRVSIFTAGHPVDADERRRGLEFGRPITVGDNVWIGGGAIINPGVTIGDNAVIGAGSVVTQDVPANVVAAGVPARAIREL